MFEKVLSEKNGVILSQLLKLDSRMYLDENRQGG